MISMAGTVRAISTVLIVWLTCGQASARGGFQSEDPYNPQHVESLPAEIRAAINKGCRAPKALHHFASYFDNANRVVLHFEHLHCDGRSAFCGPSGCLHQVWVLTGGRYKLVRGYSAASGD